VEAGKRNRASVNRPENREVNEMVEDFTVIATAAISGTVGVLAALVGAYTSAHVANVETRRRQWDYLQKRRAERQETY
jgi:hypothetical protein